MRTDKKVKTIIRKHDQNKDLECSQTCNKLVKRAFFLSAILCAPTRVIRRQDEQSGTKFIQLMGMSQHQF